MLQPPLLDHGLAFLIGTQAGFARATAHINGIGWRWHNSLEFRPPKTPLSEIECYKNKNLVVNKKRNVSDYPLTVGKENPYVDWRLGGKPRHFLTPRTDFNMRLPNEVLKSVVFLGKKRGEEIRYGGTGFLVCVTQIEDGRTFQFYYLVTADHVSKQISGDVFYIRVNQRDGHAVDIPLNWEQGNEVIWYRHPIDAHADVAVTPITPQRGHDFLFLQAEDDLISDEKREQLGIGIGDEVFMVGLFGYVKGKSRSIPIVRVGNIAMFPDERVKVKTLRPETLEEETLEVEGFLVEARSIRAASGSPVFARRTITIHQTFHKWGTSEYEDVGATAATLYLIGLVCAHWDIEPSELVGDESTQGVNVGIAVIIPAQKILDTLYRPELIDMRRNAMKNAKRRNPDRAAVMDSGFEEKPFTKADFEQALKKASRKIQPKIK